MVKTTIMIEDTTRDLLKHVGRKEQSYDQLINELIKNTVRSNGGVVAEK
jgi:hypothetical protein